MLYFSYHFIFVTLHLLCTHVTLLSQLLLYYFYFKFLLTLDKILHRSVTLYLYRNYHLHYNNTYYKNDIPNYFFFYYVIIVVNIICFSLSVRLDSIEPIELVY